MTNKYIAGAALVAASLGAQAHAATYAVSLHGAGIAAHIVLTYGVNPNTGILPGTSPNPVDPIGSYIVTGISGTFSDANAGVATTITGIVPSSPANPEPGNTFAPHSFGFYNTASQNFSYDNLYYPGGSPQVAPPSDYPFHGGFLDIYGIVFTLADGKAVNLWSDGYSPELLRYGVGLTDGTTTLDYQFNGVIASVPEPATWALMLGGFVMVGTAVRRRKSIDVTA